MQEQSNYKIRDGRREKIVLEQGSILTICPSLDYANLQLNSMISILG